MKRWFLVRLLFRVLRATRLLIAVLLVHLLFKAPPYFHS